MEGFLRRVSTIGFRRGVGGNRGWLYVAMAAFGLRLLRNLASSEPEILYRTRVAPGERFVITTKAPPTRRSRRSDRRS
jgi:hypothetical protein